MNRADRSSRRGASDLPFSVWSANDRSLRRRLRRMLRVALSRCRAERLSYVDQGSERCVMNCRPLGQAAPERIGQAVCSEKAESRFLLPSSES